MGFDWPSSFRRTTVHEDVVEVRLYELPHRPEELRTSLLNVAGALDSPWGMTNHSHNIPLGVLTASKAEVSDSRINS
ncbi:hypothetical protein PF003_g35386 [Phytophthora fragariae]|nr:hypothetical protein PF003_g35386 [Phytophthora fragariae]